MGVDRALQLAVHARSVGFDVVGGEMLPRRGQLGHVARGRQARVHAQHLGAPSRAKRDSEGTVAVGTP